MPHETDLEDVFAWADGVKSALGTPDLAHKITDEEVAISAAILYIKAHVDEVSELSEEFENRLDVYEEFSKG